MAEDFLGESDMNWELIPAHIQDGVKRYIWYGVPPGGFLTAVICNDLKNAVGKADLTNQRKLSDIVRFFYVYAPPDCWGSEDQMRSWVARKGLNGPTLEIVNG